MKDILKEAEEQKKIELANEILKRMAKDILTEKVSLTTDEHREIIGGRYHSPVWVIVKDIGNIFYSSNNKMPWWF